MVDKNMSVPTLRPIENYESIAQAQQDYKYILSSSKELICFYVEILDAVNFKYTLIKITDSIYVLGFKSFLDFQKSNDFLIDQFSSSRSKTSQEGIIIDMR